MWVCVSGRLTKSMPLDTSVYSMAIFTGKKQKFAKKQGKETKLLDDKFCEAKLTIGAANVIYVAKPLGRCCAD